MTTYTLITSGGRKTTVEGYLAEVIESQKTRRTSVGVYCGGLLICVVSGREVMMAIG